MVLPILVRLASTSGLREALPFLTKLTRDNPAASIESILKAGRNAGLSYPNDPARALVRQLRSNFETAKRLKGIDFDTTIPESAMGIGETKLLRDYSYNVRISGFNPATGEREHRNVTVSSDMLLTVNDIFETVLNMPNDRPGSMILSNTTLELEGALINPLAL